MGIYLLWAVMTILSTRVYLNLVFLARKPTLEPTTYDSRAEFSSPSLLAGIKMQIQRTTVVEREMVTFGKQGTRLTRPGRTFDAVRKCSLLLERKLDEWSLIGSYSLLNRHLKRMVSLHQAPTRHGTTGGGFVDDSAGCIVRWRFIYVIVLQASLKLRHQKGSVLYMKAVRTGLRSIVSSSASPVALW